MARTALVIFGDPDAAARLAACLPRLWHAVPSGGDRDAAEKVGAGGIDLIIMGLEGSGLEESSRFSEIRRLAPWTPILVALPVERRDSVPSFLAGGAADYLLMPFLPAEVQIRVEGAAARLSQAAASHWRRGEEVVLLGPSPAMQAIREQVGIVAPTEIPALLHGESGTGRGIIARQIHAQSAKSMGPFVVVNCSGVAEKLFETGFFGKEDAGSHVEGQLEKAGGGTLFFDEVADLPLGFQAKLLRFMHDREYVREREDQPRSTGVRFLFASSRDLGEEVAAGRMREDLYYRLQTFPLHVPPLRERIEDIPVLAGAFLQDFCGELGKPFEGIEEGALKCMLWYPWPGNVRELQARMRFCALYMSHPTLVREDLPFECRGRADDAAGSYAHARIQFEREFIVRLLRKHQGNINRMSKESGKQRVEIYRILKRCGLNPQKYRNK